MASEKKRYTCSSGKHTWPWPLEETAKRCCSDYPIDSLKFDPQEARYFACTSGKHVWSHKEEADMCCNGYVPVWETVGKEGTKENPFTWRELNLKRVSELEDMDARSSTPHASNHLKKPM